MPSSTQTAYEIIRERIISCKYMPGEILSESSMMRELNIGRTPIREALIRLESESFVRIFPKRGVFVSDISVQDINDVFGLLYILEPVAAKEAIKNADKEKLEEFLRIFEDPDDSYYEKNYFEVDYNFHYLINSSSSNHLLTTTLMDLYARNTRIRHSKYVKKRMYRTKKEHAGIIRAILAGDPELVEQRMHEHIINGRTAALS